ncbi:MAG: DUF115 domain-containing protein [Spirochaetales bacterium]|nr:DUF115 domain-containing protein [Spirochaetales bacterium]
MIQGPGGPVVHYRGRPLTGPEPYLSQTRRLPTELREQTLYLIYAPLFGFGIDAWFPALPATSAVITVELDAMLADRAVIRPTWTERERCKGTTNADDALRGASTLIRRLAIRRVESITLSGGARLHRHGYQALKEHIASHIRRFWRNRGTEVLLGRRWIVNLARNAVCEARPITELSALFGDRALLAGAGPGLEAVLPTLRDFFSADREGPRDGTRAVRLVAIDTALPALASAGVRPDAVLSLDGQLTNARDFLPWRWSETVLLADATTHFSIVRRFPPDSRFLFVSRFSDVSFFTERIERGPAAGTAYTVGDVLTGLPIVAPRGSIAPAAIELLARYGAVTDIVCTGIDFWYRPPATHARMSSIDRIVRRATDRLHHRDGAARILARPWTEARLRDGRSVRSDRVLADHAEQMRAVVEDAAQRGVTVRHIAAPGLPISTEELSIDEMRRWCQTVERAGTERDRATVAGAAGTADGRAPHDDAIGRRAALEALRHRLETVERRLKNATLPVTLDAGLEFALFDLPQWPLATVKREWMGLHRTRILGCVADYRRRIARALRAAGDVTPPASL